MLLPPPHPATITSAIAAAINKGKRLFTGIVFLTSRLSKKYDIKIQRPSLALLIQALTLQLWKVVECCVQRKHSFPSAKFFVHKLRSL
jgi:hypothetical protein